MEINKSTIRIFSFLTLVITSLSLWQTSINNKTFQAEAAINPNEEPIVEYTLPNGTETNSIRSDMDDEGNQYFTWETTEAGPCNYIYYQVYNKSGIPITQPNIVSGSCIAADDYTDPDIIVNDNYFVITYTKKVGSSYSVEMIPYSRDTYLTAHVLQQVDNGLILDANARPRISSTKTGDETGITFQACDDVSCTDHEVYFQGFDNLLDKAHALNVKINSSATGNQIESNISYSGIHFLIVFTESGVTADTTVQASAINYLGDSQSPEINIDTDISTFADVAGTLDADLSATTIIESFYIAYNYEVSGGGNSEIRMKKIYCEYNTVTPLTYACNKTSRDGETVYARVSAPNNTETKSAPHITLYKNDADMKRVPPYENTNIDQIAVAWEETISSTPYVMIQNYTDTLTKSGSIIISDLALSNSDSVSISSNRDGHYVITYNSSNTNHAKTYPTQLLKLENERLVNAPDSNIQANPHVDKNSNGDYVIVYEHFNGTDYDIIYSLFDKYGTPLKSTTIANTYTTGDQTNPKVAFWNEDTASPNYGKFLIAWEGEGATTSNGIYTQKFNADGSTFESIQGQHAYDAANYSNSDVDLATGKFNQTIVIYKEHNNAPVEDKIRIHYQDNNNGIHYLLSSTGTFSTPAIALSPEADGSVGPSGKTKFAAVWNDGTDSYKTEGYLIAGNNFTLSSGPTTVNNILFEDLDGGYNSTLSTLTPVLDPFYYASTSYNSVSGNEELVVRFYGSAYTDSSILETDSGSRVSIDPASQNIFTIGQKFANYNDYIDPGQVILIASDAVNNISNGQLLKEDFTASANVIDTGTFHADIEDVTGTFAAGDRVGTITGYTSTSVANTTVLNFATDISTHFIISQTVTDPTFVAQGQVVAISNFYIVLEGVTGAFNAGGGTLNNGPFNDNYSSANTGSNIYFAPNEGSNFEIDNYVSKDGFTAIGYIKNIENTFITAINITGTFSAAENILDFNNTGTIIYDSIEYIGGRYYIFSIVADEPIWTATGPTLSVNEYSYYGQSYNSSAAAYDTRASDNAGKFTTAVYANNSSPDYLDENGVFQQRLEDPYTLGQKEDLSPTTAQEIEAGGKYIVVPQTIDFGNISRNTTEEIDFATLTPSCLTVTDLDGTDFDLTVSLTDLTNIDIPADSISNTNFIIENNNGSNPNVISLVTFSEATDVTISPTTNPGQDANLGVTQTLLTKSKPYTGSWEICPNTKLTIPSDASSGNYAGTLTFTLI